MRKSILFFIGLVLSVSFATAQVVKIKKGEVYLNDKVILKYDKINLAQVSFHSLNGDELLFYSVINNCHGLRSNDDDCMLLNFVTAKIKFRVSDWSRVATLGVTHAMEKLIKWLAEEKVITETGELNLEKLAVFRDKFEDPLR